MTERSFSWLVGSMIVGGDRYRIEEERKRVKEYKLYDMVVSK